jgi:hypothetical protein
VIFSVDKYGKPLTVETTILDFLDDSGNLVGNSHMITSPKAELAKYSYEMSTSRYLNKLRGGLDEDYIIHLWSTEQNILEASSESVGQYSYSIKPLWVAYYSTNDEESSEDVGDDVWGNSNLNDLWASED